MNIPDALRATPAPTASPQARTGDVGGLDGRRLRVALGVPVREADGRQRPELGHSTAPAAVRPDRLLEPRSRQKLRLAGQDPNKPFITCAEDGSEKYILGPAELVGTDVSGATAGLETNSQGLTRVPTGRST